MITAYVLRQAEVRVIQVGKDHLLPPGTVWVDVFTPTNEEVSSIERQIHIDPPTSEEMQDIEISSKLYRDSGSLYMIASVLVGTSIEHPEIKGLTFILTKDILVTVRYVEFPAVTALSHRILRQPEIFTNEAILVALIEEIIDYAGHELKNLGLELDLVSRNTFTNKSGPHRFRSKNELVSALQQIGRAGDLVSQVNDSLLSIRRLLVFCKEHSKDLKRDKLLISQVDIIERDVDSLIERTSFLTEKVDFLLDAQLGIINAEQNTIIKIFSVAAVVLLPPTLIASIYGMNFAFMPELAWHYGYPFAVLLMIISGIIPYVYFHRKGWI